jgi:hypothetical protein
VAWHSSASHRLTATSPYEHSWLNSPYRGIVISSGASDLDNAVSKSDGYGVCPIESPELSNGGLDMLVDGSFGDMKDFGDLRGGLALRHP